MTADPDDLRLLLWEVIPDNGTEADTFFTDDQVDQLIKISGGVLERAAAVGWAVKGGYYAQMVDVEESGSIRRLRQMYANCDRQFQIFDKLAATKEAAIGAATIRVVGQSFCILGDERTNTFNEFDPRTDSEMGAVYLRQFPLHRFPAVLN